MYVGQRLASPVVAMYPSPVRHAEEFGDAAPVAEERGGRDFLWLLEHEAHAADMDRGDGAVAAVAASSHTDLARARFFFRVRALHPREMRPHPTGMRPYLAIGCAARAFRSKIPIRNPNPGVAGEAAEVMAAAARCP